jgi:hypothetical protein
MLGGCVINGEADLLVVGCLKLEPAGLIPKKEDCVGFCGCSNNCPTDFVCTLPAKWMHIVILSLKIILVKRLLDADNPDKHLSVIRSFSHWLRTQINPGRIRSTLVFPKHTGFRGCVSRSSGTSSP